VTDPVRALFQEGVLQRTPFAPTSRYHGVATARLATPRGTVVYLRRRFVPPPAMFALLRERVVRQGDRLDTITAEELGDPEQFWRLCDANGVLRPDDLVDRVGGRIRITLPAGVPGQDGAAG
jgi:hypothetical protein